MGQSDRRKLLGDAAVLGRQTAAGRCTVCGGPAAVCRVMLSGARVCCGCNPWRRCECLGVYEHRETPDDMGRMACSRCGHVRRGGQ